VCDSTSLLVEEAVVSRKDFESFSSLSFLMSGLLSISPDSFGYHSVHDINVSVVSSYITHDDICCLASLEEIKRREIWYQAKNPTNSLSTQSVDFESLLQS
jgi:uncharacterized protein (UPF0371 family)